MTTDLPLIPARNVVAHFARWAVQLAPLGTPERLPECLAALRVYIKGEWSIDSVRDLLTRFTATDPMVRLWSYPLVKQDDPREPPREEHLHITPQDLVDRVVASLALETRHAAELYAAPPMDAETVKGLRLTGFNVHVRPAGQSEYVDFGSVDAATTEQATEIPPAITPSRPPGFKYSYEVEDHLTPNVHVRVVISGRRDDYLLPVGDCLRAAMTVMSFNLSYRGALFPREGIMGPYTPDRVCAAQEKVRALLRIADAAEHAPPRVTEIDLEATMPDMRMLLDGLAERFPANFLVRSVVGVRGWNKEYRGLVDEEVSAEIMRSGQGGSYTSNFQLQRALMTLGRQRGWTARIEEDALSDQIRERKVRLTAGPFECVVRTTDAQVSVTYMVGVAMLQVPVEVSE